MSDWLAPASTWVLDEEAYRSSALPGGEGSSLLGREGVWRTASSDTEEPWVMFDLGASLELDQIEIVHQADHQLKPKACEWQFFRRNFWVCAAKFELPADKEKNCVSFRATEAQQWKLVVKSTHDDGYASSDGGVSIQQVRLHGITQEAAEAERIREELFMTSPEGRPGRAVSG